MLRLATLALVAALSAATAGAQPLALDPDYGTDGRSDTFVTESAPNSPPGFTVDSKGRALVAYSYEALNVGYVVVRRYLPNGTLDAAFGADGRALEEIRGARVLELGVDEKDRAVVLGTYRTESQDTRPFAIRLAPDGTLDSDFGGGVVRLPLLAVGALDGLAVLDDGSFATGFVLEDGETCGVFRVNAFGNLDSFFGDGGVAFTPNNGIVPCAPGEVRVDAEGGYLFGGSKTFGTRGRDMYLVRFIDDGFVDPTFGASGTVTIDFEEFNDRVQFMELDSAGRILLGGTTRKGDADGALVARILPDGTPDPAFGDAGRSWTPYQDDAEAYWAFVGLGLDTEDRALLLYARGRAGAVVGRLDTGGTPDPTVATDGGIALGFAFSAGEPTDRGTSRALRVRDGAPFVLGSRTTTSNRIIPTVVRLAPVPVSADARPSVEASLAVAPNPLRDRATVRLSLGAPADVDLVVYDALGRRVATLHDGPAPAGELRATWDAGDAAPGVYVVHARVGADVTTRTVSVAR